MAASRGAGDKGAGAGVPSVLVLTDERPDMDALNWKVHKVHTDMDYVKNFMGSELNRICQGLQDARVTVDNHESELSQLWRASRTAEAEVRELNRLVEKVGSKLHELLHEARAETARLQEELSRGLDGGRLELEGRVQELRGLVCAGDLEQGRAAERALQEAQAWQARAELRIANLDDCLARARTEAAMSTEAVRDELRRAFEEIQERERLVELHQKGVEDSLHGEAKALSEKQAHCASELHRLVRGLGQKVDAGQEQQLGLERALSRTRTELAEQRDGQSEELQAGLLRTAEQASDGRAALARRLDEQIGGLEARLCAAAEECRAWPAALAGAETRLSKEDETTREHLESEIAKCRLWSSERLVAEVGKLDARVEELVAQLAVVAARLAGQEDKVSALSTSLSDAEGRLSKEDAAFREKLAGVSNALSATEARLVSEDALTREQLNALSATIASTENHLRGEDALTREQMDTMSAEQARAHRELCKRLEALAAQLAGAESRLAGEDGAVRERLEALSATLKSTDQRLSEEGVGIRKQVQQLSHSLSASEVSLCSEGAALRERLDAQQEQLQVVEGRLSREDTAARERLESLASTMTTIEKRFSTCDAATRQRLEALAAELAGAESRLSRDLAARSRQLDTLGSQLVGAENRLQSEDAFLRARVEALTASFDSAEHRRGGEDAATRERLEALSAGLAGAEGRLGREGAVLRDRLEQFGATLSSMENRMGGEHATARKQLEALSAALAKTESQACSELATVRERMEALSSALSGAESRLSTEDTAIRDRMEERIKEEISWMLALVKPIQQSIDKLAWGFHDLGCSHVRCAREFEVLEQVIKDVEVRVLPWRSGLDRDTLRFARLVQPATSGSLTDGNCSPVQPRCITDGSTGCTALASHITTPTPTGFFSPPVNRPRGQRRPASARPGSGLAKRLVAESEQRPSSALTELAEHLCRPGAAPPMRSPYAQPP